MGNSRCILIRMEYLAANALVELAENRNINQISFENLWQYALKVEAALNIQGNSRVILLWSNHYINKFMQDYADWFEVINDYIQIRSSVTVEDIREHVLSYVPMDVLIALLDENALQLLNAA